MWKMEECTQRTESPHTNRQLLCQQLAGTKKMNDHHCKPFEGVWGSQEGFNSIRGCVSIGCALHIKSNIYEWRSDVPLSGGCPLTVYKIQLGKEHGQVELHPDISDVSEMWHNGLSLLCWWGSAQLPTWASSAINSNTLSHRSRNVRLPVLCCSYTLDC